MRSAESQTAPALGLAHLRAVGLGEQRAGEAVELHAAHPPGQVDAGRDVAPLVAAADLQLAAVLVVQVHEVVRLQQHVAELGVAQARVGRARAGSSPSPWRASRSRESSCRRRAGTRGS